MTFVGESVPLTSGAAGGVDDAWLVTYRGGSQALSGTPWVLWSNEPPLLLAPGDACVVSWVVEVVGGSGTITAEETLHTVPDDEAGASWSALGSHAVSGTQTLVMASTVTTGADLLAGMVPGLRLSATGTVIVEQIKVRVWPPTGALGGWSAPQPIEEQGPFLARITRATFDTPEETFTGGTDAIEAMHQAMLALVPSVGGETVTGFTGGDSLWTQIAAGEMRAVGSWNDISGDLAAGLAEGMGGVGYVERPPLSVSPTPPGTFGVDWVYPPNEIPWDDASPLFPLDPGDGSFVWGPNKTITLHLRDANSPPGDYLRGPWSVKYVATESTAADEAVQFAALVADTPTTLITRVQAADDDFRFAELPEFPAGQALRLVVFHYNHFSGDPQSLYSSITGHTTEVWTGAGGGNLVAGLFDGSTVTDRPNYYWTPPPFRYWSPTVVRRIPLRQFHRDDGLGVAPPRAFGGASRIRTGRAYGYD